MNEVILDNKVTILKSVFGSKPTISGVKFDVYDDAFMGLLPNDNIVRLSLLPNINHEHYDGVLFNILDVDTKKAIYTTSFKFDDFTKDNLIVWTIADEDDKIFWNVAKKGVPNSGTRSKTPPTYVPKSMKTATKAIINLFK